MKQVTINGIDLLLVQVPDNIIEAEIIDESKGCRIPVDLEILGFSDTITEEQAAGIVEKWTSKVDGTEHYFNHSQPFSSNPNECFCNTALESLQSLIRSQGLDGRVLIVKIKTV